MPTLLDIHVVYVIIEEYLGWLPCLALRATRASALHPSVLLRMREILRLFPGRMNPPFPSLTFRSQGSALWRVIIEPLRRSETPARIGGYQLPALFGRRLAERRVIVRYDRRREVWYHGPGQLLQREDIAQAFPDASFNEALTMVQEHGSYFVARQASAFRDVREGDVLLTEVFALDCTYLGFEISLRMSFRSIIPYAQG